jgi:hypothetical protein
VEKDNRTVVADEQWIVSRSDDWFSSSFFETKEAAIGEAANELGIKVGDIFYVGKVRRPLKPVQDAHDIAEDIVNRHAEKLDDWVAEEAGLEALDGHSMSDSIPIGTSKDAIERITAILNEITPEPTFYAVVNTEACVVLAADEGTESMKFTGPYGRTNESETAEFGIRQYILKALQLLRNGEDISKAIEWLEDGLEYKQQPAIDLIAGERQRQIEEEGWTSEHDDAHNGNQIAMAAACYASPVPLHARVEVPCGCREASCEHSPFGKFKWINAWPWDKSMDKHEKHSRIRQLVIAGALIAAEIDRQSRLPEEFNDGV